MTCQTPENDWWYAIARQIGTNDRLEVAGPTREDVDRQLFGRAYAAEWGTVRYFRMPAPVAGEQVGAA